MIYFSPSTNGFYLQGIHSKIPNDVIEITEEQHAELLEAQTTGKTIVYQDGKVQAIFASIPLTWEDVRYKRDALIAKSDWTQFPDVTMETDTKQAWIEYRQALRDITDTFSDPNDVVWPSTPTK